MRWHPRYRRAAELLGSAASGAVHEIGATFTFDGVPEDNYRKQGSLGGGALLDQPIGQPVRFGETLPISA